MLIIFLTGAFIGAAGLWLAFQYNVEFRCFLFEEVEINLPRSQVDAFVQSILQGDQAEAFRLWEVYDDPSSVKQKSLMKRRAAVLSDMFSANIEPEYRVLDVEWWTTCCEPHVTNNSRSAGGARIRVQFIDENGSPVQYIFDVFTREQPYWGDAAGNPLRDWVIKDVYPREETPLFWQLVFEPQVQYVQLPEP